MRHALIYLHLCCIAFGFGPALDLSSDPINGSPNQVYPSRRTLPQAHGIGWLADLKGQRVQSLLHESIACVARLRSAPEASRGSQQRCATRTKCRRLNGDHDRESRRGASGTVAGQPHHLRVHGAIAPHVNSYELAGGSPIAISVVFDLRARSLRHGEARAQEPHDEIGVVCGSERRPWPKPFIEPPSRRQASTRSSMQAPMPSARGLSPSPLRTTAEATL